jgi:hypothetical protein
MDYQMLKALEFLAERPLEYEAGHPIRGIERAILAGLAEQSEPYRAYSGRPPRWRTVTKVKLSEAGRAALPR